MEFEHAVGEHLRPNAQLAVLLQVFEYGVRHRADAELECGPVLDLIRDGPADLFGDSSRMLGRVRHEWLVNLDEVVDLVVVDLGVTVGVGHVGVGLHDDGCTVLARRLESRG